MEELSKIQNHLPLFSIIGQHGDQSPRDALPLPTIWRKNNERVSALPVQVRRRRDQYGDGHTGGRCLARHGDRPAGARNHRVLLTAWM